MPSFPVRFDGAPASVKPLPLSGEHTAEVFGEWLDMSVSDVAALRDRGRETMRISRKLIQSRRAPR